MFVASAAAAAAERFISKLVKTYGLHPVSTDGVHDICRSADS
jgi:hypothetical protein